ncbi:methyltransferase domain-containing protein [Ferruginivarius sediminum]|nr:class I SAM-dependent methyltransferase [Ferruginivarius sediminum]
MTVETKVSTKYEPEELWFPCSLDIMGWDEHFHNLMLNDRLRMAVYKKAVKNAIEPGMAVLDLGTGTGILARWALEAGAARVYGIEVSRKILDIAEANLAQAGVADRFTPINDLSYNVELPEKVDIIVSEIIGNIGDNEDCAPILADARDRFLKPGGTMLPQRLTPYFVPVASPATNAQIQRGVCKSISAEQDLQVLLDRLGVADPCEVYYDVVIPRSRHLAEPLAGRTLDFFSDGGETAYSFSLTFTATADGEVTGIKGYFIAQLTDRDVLDISGDDPVSGTASDSWKHCYMPLARPLRVKAGDRIRLDVERWPEKNESSAFAFRYRWRAEVLGDGA